LNREELFNLIKKKASTKESCMTKSELGHGKTFHGISGKNMRRYLEYLESVGRVKHTKKCVQWTDGYYLSSVQKLEIHVLIADKNVDVWR